MGLLVGWAGVPLAVLEKSRRSVMDANGRLSNAAGCLVYRPEPCLPRTVPPRSAQDLAHRHSTQPIASMHAVTDDGCFQTACSRQTIGLERGQALRRDRQSVFGIGLEPFIIFGSKR